MQTDQSLIREVKRHFRGAVEELREEVDQQCEDYRSACIVSRGPNTSRAEHWEPKAKAAEKVLRRRMVAFSIRGTATR